MLDSINLPLDSLSNLLIDTHTHFDLSVFDTDWQTETEQAYDVGIRKLLLVGYVASEFKRLRMRELQINQVMHNQLSAHVAYGLHPAYVDEHCEADLEILAETLTKNPTIAIGEIGLDTYTAELKRPDSIFKQLYFFERQLDLAVQCELPVLLHIRKAHAQVLHTLKNHAYEAHELGGIAHSFSGGEQEADAFVKLGFKLGVTGQITNPNAKKLHRAICSAVDKHGLGCLVIETDCPDMVPIPCQYKNNDDNQDNNRNVPANLPYVLMGLSELLGVEAKMLAQKLWHNSMQALKQDWGQDD